MIPSNRSVPGSPEERGPDPEVWDYTLLTAVARGWGLAIVCKTCGSRRRWSDRMLAERFAGSLDAPVSRLRPALVCRCGARSARLFYYNAGSLDTGAGGAMDIAEREAALRAIPRRSPPLKGDVAPLADAGRLPSPSGDAGQEGGSQGPG